MSVFTETLIISPLPDGKRWVLRREFFYDIGEEGSGDRVTVPVGFVTDFASVPSIFATVLPKWGKYGNAVIIHDYLYWEGSRKRKECDFIFFEAMRVLGVSLLKRYIMYGAVRVFGWTSYASSKKGEKKIFIIPLNEEICLPKMNLKVFEGY